MDTPGKIIITFSIRILVGAILNNKNPLVGKLYAHIQEIGNSVNYYRTRNSSN